MDKRGKHVGGSNEWGYCDHGCLTKAGNARPEVDEDLQVDAGSDAITFETTPAATAATTITATTGAATARTELLPRSGDSTESGTFLPEPESGLCGLPVGTGFIIGGEDTKRGSFPFVAVLGFDVPEGSVFIDFYFRGNYNEVFSN